MNHSLPDSTPMLKSPRPYNDCCCGSWLAWHVGCSNAACIGNPSINVPERVPTGVVSWSSSIQVHDGTTRSLLRLKLHFASVIIMLDSNWGTHDGVKDEGGDAGFVHRGFVHRGRLPTWPGSHCPLCRTVLNQPDGQPNCALHCTLPHICVSSVERIPDTDTLRVRLDSPTMLDFWLELHVPSWMLPPPPGK